MSNYRDLHIDIETMGTDVNTAPILSIGVVPFHAITGEIFEDDGIEIHLSLEEQLNGSRILNVDTLLWWMDQSNEARNRVTSGQREERVSVKYGLGLLNNYLSTHPHENLWAKDPDFDVSMIKSLHSDFKGAINLATIGEPLKFIDDPELNINPFKCKAVRTIIDAARSIIPTYGEWDKRNSGVEHGALADAINQSKTVIECYNIIGGASDWEIE